MSPLSHALFVCTQVQTTLRRIKKVMRCVLHTLQQAECFWGAQDGEEPLLPLCTHAMVLLVLLLLCAFAVAGSVQNESSIL